MEIDKVKQGKKNRAAGARFELKVRKFLEESGYVVDKWSNNVDLEKGAITQAKKKFNPHRRAMALGTGFPDFIALKKDKIILVECKKRKYLDKVEKEKVQWLLKNSIFNKIFVAYQNQETKEIKWELKTQDETK